MNRIMLPLGKPRIVGYLHHAFAHSIMTPHRQYEPWLYSNYIQLFCNNAFSSKNCPANFFLYDDYFHYPLLSIETMTRNTVLTFSNIIDFIMKSVANGFHVLTYVNEFYIPQTRQYQKANLTHDLLISGYCEDEGNLLVSSFFNSQYGTTLISFEDYMRAFDSSEFVFDYLRDVKLIRANDNADYSFNMDLVIYFLKDYLQSSNRLKTDLYPDERELSFGLSVYEAISNHVTGLLINDNSLDIRPLHILYEHKRCMSDRMKYMLSHGYMTNKELLDRYQEVEQMANNIRLSGLRCLMKKEEMTIRHIASQLHEMMKKEEDILGALLTEVNGR